MNEHRRQILQMLSESKISADEAERLIAALEEPVAGSSRRTHPTRERSAAQISSSPGRLGR